MDEVSLSHIPVAFIKTSQRILREGRTTFLLAGIIVFFYIGVLFLEGNYTSGAAYTYLNNINPPFQVFVRLLSPVLHSTHTHIAENLLVYFIPFGVLVERRTSSVHLILFTISVGMISNSVIAPIFGHAAIGLSCVNFGLLASESLHRANRIRTEPALHLTDVTVFCIALFLLGIGFWIPTPGASDIAHASGFISGVLWQIYKSMI
jgi:membrane associated rhomboid family serine protease